MLQYNVYEHFHKFVVTNHILTSSNITTLLYCMQMLFYSVYYFFTLVLQLNFFSNFLFFVAHKGYYTVSQKTSHFVISHIFTTY